jgi:hypothetical protein
MTKTIGLPRSESATVKASVEEAEGGNASRGWPLAEQLCSSAASKKQKTPRSTFI